MVGHQARWSLGGRGGVKATEALALAAFLGCVAVGLALPAGDRVDALSGILGVGALVAGVLATGSDTGSIGVSASFLVMVLAGLFLGPRSAMAAAVLSEISAAARWRTPTRTVVLINLPGAVLSALAGAMALQLLSAGPGNRLGFYATAAFAAVLTITLSFVIFATLRRVFFPHLEQFGFRAFLSDLPSTALNIALVVAGAGITVAVGRAGVAFALSGVLTFSYMAHLLAESRHRAEQYVSLSWGVLAGLMRALDVRDQRAARHAAAVARFARDMAAEVGMSEPEQELAHTAGLLHDIGHFALSDRVHEAGRTLTEEDWLAIQRHPELGADMLRDLGMYGPVAEIVLAHHERIDGRGYPKLLLADEIPEIAKIIAVAEVYDTLTAADTYRTRMSSFEALRELRRVSGSQLDERYVEVLAGLLSGEGIDYRHADAADFDTELDMERRVREARTG